jgi:hypothetical protein
MLASAQLCALLPPRLLVLILKAVVPDVYCVYTHCTGHFVSRESSRWTAGATEAGGCIFDGLPQVMTNMFGIRMVL